MDYRIIILRDQIITAIVGVALIGGAQVAMADEAMSDKALENFLTADGNGDGALTREEFGALIELNAECGIGRAAVIRRAGRQDFAFNRLDADGDGLATQEELSAMRDRTMR